jgi:hypothetical protein
MAGAKVRAMLVSAIGLAMNSRSSDSTPAAPVCTQRTLVAAARSAPVRLPNTTSASGSRRRNSSGVFTTIISTLAAADLKRSSSCGSNAVAVSTRIGSADRRAGGCVGCVAAAA